jgi:hypothetical protein
LRSVRRDSLYVPRLGQSRCVNHLEGRNQCILGAEFLSRHCRKTILIGNSGQDHAGDRLADLIIAVLALRSWFRHSNPGALPMNKTTRTHRAFNRHKIQSILRVILLGWRINVRRDRSPKRAEGRSGDQSGVGARLEMKQLYPPDQGSCGKR